MKRNLLTALLLAAFSSFAHAGFDLDKLKTPSAADLQAKAAEQAREKARAKGNEQIAKQVNKQLLAEGRKNQCSFKSGSDELEAGCGKKSKKLADKIIAVKKKLQGEGQTGFKFIVSGHTDSSGDAAKNQDLSARRAQVMVNELIAQGVDAGDIEAVGMGAQRPLVKNDDTAAKKAKNRRYEVEVRF